MGKLGTATKSFFNSLLDREIPRSSNQVNGLASLNSNSTILQSIHSSAFESLNQQFYTRLAQSIDPIDSAITFYAEILASGVLKSTDKNKKDVTDSDELVTLLKNPNEQQNFQQFIKEYLYYLYSHGWTYIVPQSSSVGFEKKIKGTTKTQLFNVDPDNIKFINKNSIWNLFKSNDISFDYEILDFKNIDFKNVINFIDVRQNSQKPHIGVSRLLALKQQIENWSLGGQAKENMIKRSGSTLVSLDGKVEDIGLDSSVGTGEFDKDGNPILTTHKEKLDTQLEVTGLGSGSKSVIFSTLPLKSQPLSAGLESIPFDDMMVEDARQIYNKFNVPKEFQNLSKESAKFLNRQMAMVEVIQNTIEPLARSFCQKIQSYFDWENTIEIDFSHLPIFSENENDKVATKQAIVNLYSGLLEKELIKYSEFQLILKENGIIK